MKTNRTTRSRIIKRYAAASAAFVTVAVSLAGCGHPADIGKDKASDIALEDAGLDESDVTRLRISKDTDDGERIYEVKFTNGNTEYDYEILASNGDILSADYEESRSLGQTGQISQPNSSDSQDSGTWQDVPNSRNQGGQHDSSDHSHLDQTADTQANVPVSIEQASKLALDRVPGASAQDLKIELDYDDGYYKYEGDIIYDQKEYDFEIDANTGDFLEWKEERR